MSALPNDLSKSSQSWYFPKEPWKGLYIYYARQFLGKWNLFMINSYYKWLEIEIDNLADKSITIERLRQIFSTHRLPSTVASDNGSVFTSEEFSTYMSCNGSHHIRTIHFPLVLWN
uniref:Integrase catalytic domain-containing protein n=1 Tax=Amphimedon queenslandica TaxID=400682 RepID=A0A1X7TYZ4_AMPQE